MRRGVHEVLHKAVETGTSEDWFLFVSRLKTHTIRVVHPLGVDKLDLEVDASAFELGACST